MTESDPLTERELEILQQVATGASNRQIGQRLGISPNTVKVHLHNIYSKLDVASRTEATLYAVQAGLIDGVDVQEMTGRQAWWQRGRSLVIAAFLMVALALLIGTQLRPAVDPGENAIDLNELESQRWQELAPMPTARKGLAVAAFDGKIYAIGGETVDGVTDTVERYDPATDTWRTLPPKPTAVTDARAAVVGGKIYVPGGKLATGLPTENVDVFDVSTERWESVGPLPWPVADYALAAFEGTLYLFGGTGKAGPLKSTMFYSPGGEWQPGPPMPVASSHAVAITAPDSIFVGLGDPGESAHGRLLRYTPGPTSVAMGAWSTASTLPERVRFAGGGLFLGNLYLMAPSEANGAGQVLQFRLSEGQWVEDDLPVMSDWRLPRIVAAGEHLYVLGGEINGLPTGRIGRYQVVYTLLLPLVR